MGTWVKGKWRRNKGEGVREEGEGGGMGGGGRGRSRLTRRGMWWGSERRGKGEHAVGSRTGRKGGAGE